MTETFLTRPQRLVMLVLLVFSAYGRVLSVPFLWDDHVMIEHNPWMREWSTAALRYDFTNDVFDGNGDLYYRPAQTLLNRVDYSIWGGHPFGFHLTNLLGHLANVLLIEILIEMLGFSALIAFMCASLFAVHPIGVEQLMIVAGRAEIFALTGSLAVLICLLRESKTTQWASVGIYIVTLFFKESAVCIPALAGFILYCRRRPRATYVIPLAMAVVTLPYLWLRQQMVGLHSAGFHASIIPLFFFMAFPRVLFSYLGRLLVPWNLHSHHLMPHITRLWPVLITPWILVIVYALYQKDRRLLLCLGLFLIPLLPKTPAMILGNFALDHWAYPSSVGFFLALAILFEAAWRNQAKPWLHAFAILYIIALVFWGLLTNLNIELRNTDEKMYRWALHFTTSHPIKYNLGILLLSDNRPREAIDYLDSVYADDPGNIRYANALARACWEVGDQRRAIAILDDALATHPNDALTLQNRKAAMAPPTRR